jgi:hypothetical protein
MANGLDLDSTTVTTASEQPAKAVQFDPSRLLVDQDFADDFGTKVILQVPIRKPNKQSYIRVHPAKEYRFRMALLILKEEMNETYGIDNRLVAELGNDVGLYQVFTCIDRCGSLFLWQIKQPGADGRLDNWNLSALRAAELARQEWVQVKAGSGGYDAHAAKGNLTEPTWPEMTPNEILTLAFKDKYINDLDHPVLRKLRGEI